MTCDCCGKDKIDVEIRIDPYEQEINDNLIERPLCNHCYTEISHDI